MQKLNHRPSVVNIMNEQYVDIICLQETWLSKQELNRICYILIFMEYG